MVNLCWERQLMTFLLQPCTILCLTKPTATQKTISCFPSPATRFLGNSVRSCTVSAVSLRSRRDVTETTVSWPQWADPTAHLQRKEIHSLAGIFSAKRIVFCWLSKLNRHKKASSKNRRQCKSGQLCWAQHEKSQDHREKAQNPSPFSSTALSH